MTTANPPSSQKILNNTEFLRENAATKEDIKELKESFRVLFNEMQDKITNLQADMLKTATAKRSTSTGGTKTASATTTTPTAEKKYSNSMYWFIGEWKVRREEFTKDFLNADIIKTATSHMETDADCKAKQGPAKADAEAKYIWNTYIKTNDTLKDKIRGVFTKEKATKERSNMTAANKEETTEVKE